VLDDRESDIENAKKLLLTLALSRRGKNHLSLTSSPLPEGEG